MNKPAPFTITYGGFAYRCMPRIAPDSKPNTFRAWWELGTPNLETKGEKGRILSVAEAERILLRATPTAMDIERAINKLPVNKKPRQIRAAPKHPRRKIRDVEATKAQLLELIRSSGGTLSITVLRFRMSIAPETLCALCEELVLEGKISRKGKCSPYKCID